VADLPRRDEKSFVEHAFFVLLIFILPILSACSGAMVEHGYHGKALPPDKVGRLIVKPPMQLRALNGDTSYNKKLLSKTIADEHRVIELKPGVYKATVYYDYKRHWSWADRTHGYSKGDMHVQFRVQAGHRYKLMYQKYPSGLIGAWVDETVDWSKIDSTAKSTYHDGRAAYTAKRYRDALKLMLKAEKQDPNFAWSYYYAGWSYIHLEQYPDAVQQFDAAVRLMPGDSDIWNAAGYAFYKAGDCRAAVNSYWEGLRIHKDGSALFNTAYCYIQLGNYRSAVKALSLYLKMYPSEPSAYQNRGVAYRKLGQHAKAEADLRKARQLRGNK